MFLFFVSFAVQIHFRRKKYFTIKLEMKKGGNYPHFETEK